jgi:hypothetical protein
VTKINKLHDMNAITKFRLCTLTDDELLGAVDAATDQMFQTGKIPDRQIPARPDADFDLIVGEMICRFIELKNALLETIEQRDRALGIMPDLPGLWVNGEPPVDHRKQPIAADWYEPGMYFKNRYRYLQEGEIVEPGDEVKMSAKYNDPPNWVPAVNTVGTPAPNPNFMAHRVYRRQIFPKRSVNAV